MFTRPIVFLNLLPCLLAVAVFFNGSLVLAAEVRVIDSQGLVRAVKITRGRARIVVSLSASPGIKLVGECVASNVDGIAAEKRVHVTPNGQCVFDDISEGAWQLTVPESATWKAVIYE